MYHPEVIDRRIYAAKKKGLIFNRLPRDRSMEITAKLELLRYDSKMNLLPEGQLARPLDEAEAAFIESERNLCKADFLYYLSRYHACERDPGVGTESGTGPAKPLQSQLRYIELVGRRELVCHQEKKKYGHTSGILIYLHKVRQVAATATFAAVRVHRMLFWPGTRCFAATLKEGPMGTGELYTRDLLALNNLPFWLKPAKLYPNVKDDQIGIENPLGTRMAYQAENQQTGIGTGTQQDVSHLTEVPLWSYPHRIRYSFVPSIPKALSTLHVQEGTSAGKGGYWQEVTEACRRRDRGFEDWIYIFLPWWVNVLKYRANVPDGWKPEEKTLKHAELVERTSPEFNDGVTYHPTREQLYWWESTRAIHAANNETASFLANYPATPEQSFSNWAQGALPVELIEELEFDLKEPMPYEVFV